MTAISAPKRWQLDYLYALDSKSAIVHSWFRIIEAGYWIFRTDTENLLYRTRLKSAFLKNQIDCLANEFNGQYFYPHLPD